MTGKSLAEQVAENREEIMRAAERQNLGAFLSESLFGRDTLVYRFERGTIHSRLPSNAVTESTQWVQRRLDKPPRAGLR
jgi:hypothetical protein